MQSKARLKVHTIQCITLKAISILLISSLPFGSLTTLWRRYLGHEHHLLFLTPSITPSCLLLLCFLRLHFAFTAFWISFLSNWTNFLNSSKSETTSSSLSSCKLGCQRKCSRVASKSSQHSEACFSGCSDKMWRIACGFFQNSDKCNINVYIYLATL